MGMVSTQLIHGDCLEVMQGMEPNSIHSIICDPPYGLSFMGKDWDHGVPGVAFWEAALRVAKPGAMLLAFGGTRTFHRLTVAIEDAGWEIRDCLMWVYGSGFPKALAIDKAIDKHLGKEREVVGKGKPMKSLGVMHDDSWQSDSGYNITAPATPEAAKWQGWHSSLKPAWEPIIMAMKPLDGTYANNALVHGVAGINVDACRIPTDEVWSFGERQFAGKRGGIMGETVPRKPSESNPQGRWPSNLLLDESAAAALDQMSGERKTGGRTWRDGDIEQSNWRAMEGRTDPKRRSAYTIEPSTGGASRFFARFVHDEDDAPSRMFYHSKASKRDRDEGLEGMEERARNSYSSAESRVGKVRSDGAIQHAANTSSRNHHPTVKPTALMRYLVRLVTPPGGTVLDPFTGSGSTGKAAVLEGFNFVGIELEPEYLAIAERRIAHAQAQAEMPTQAQPALLEVA